MNIEGELFSLAYAEPASMAVDPIEKKPLYHFMPGTLSFSLGTLGCNMRCRHCQNYDISFTDFDNSEARSTTHLPVDQVVPVIKNGACDGISFTYNEPTIWIEYMLDVFEKVKAAGLYTSVVTNAYINKEPLADLLRLTDAYRVDLKFMSREGAMALSNVPNPEAVLRSIIQAKEAEVHVEIVTNVVSGINDSTDELETMAKWIAENSGVETPWHITRSFPRPGWSVPATPVSVLIKAMEIAKEAGLLYVYPGNVAGLDANTYCPECGAVAVSRTGYATQIHAKLPYCSKCGYKMNFTV